MEPPREVLAYYDRFSEESRLSSGPSRLEFERTKEILARVLPTAPARIVDVGGAAGAYARWLAAKGYEVQLPMPGARGAGPACTTACPRTLVGPSVRRASRAGTC